jgi:hypothetical protein
MQKPSRQKIIMQKPTRKYNYEKRNQTHSTYINLFGKATTSYLCEYELFLVNLFSFMHLCSTDMQIFAGHKVTYTEIPNTRSWGNELWLQRDNFKLQLQKYYLTRPRWIQIYLLNQQYVHVQLCIDAKLKKSVGDSSVM